MIVRVNIIFLCKDWTVLKSIIFFFFQLNFRLKLKSIIQKLSEHCDIKNPEDLETEIVSKY